MSKKGATMIVKLNLNQKRLNLDFPLSGGFCCILGAQVHVYMIALDISKGDHHQNR